MAVTVLSAVTVATADRINGRGERSASTRERVVLVTLVGTATAVGLWLVALLVGYAVVAYLLLFYLPSADRLPSGTATDAAFVVTLPFVLALTWLAGMRRGA